MPKKAVSPSAFTAAVRLHILFSAAVHRSHHELIKFNFKPFFLWRGMIRLFDLSSVLQSATAGTFPVVLGRCPSCASCACPSDLGPVRSIVCGVFAQLHDLFLYWSHHVKLDFSVSTISFPALRYKPELTALRLKRAGLVPTFV